MTRSDDSRDPIDWNVIAFDPSISRKLTSTTEAEALADDASGGSVTRLQKPLREDRWVEDLVQIMFIDPDVPEPQALLEGLDPNVHVFRLHPDRDPIAEMVYYIEQFADLEVIKLFIVHCGSLGSATLCGETYTAERFREREKDLEPLYLALSPDAEVVFFGCETAGSDQGWDLLDYLGERLDANITGACSIVGHTDLVGSWDEFRPHLLPFSDKALNNYKHVLKAKG